MSESPTDRIPYCRFCGNATPSDELDEATGYCHSCVRKRNDFIAAGQPITPTHPDPPMTT